MYDSECRECALQNCLKHAPSNSAWFSLYSALENKWGILKLYTDSTSGIGIGPQFDFFFACEVEDHLQYHKAMNDSESHECAQRINLGHASSNSAQFCLYSNLKNKLGIIELQTNST